MGGPSGAAVGVPGGHRGPGAERPESELASRRGKPGEEVRAPRPRAANRAVEPSSPAWALEALNKNLIDDLSAPQPLSRQL